MVPIWLWLIAGALAVLDNRIATDSAPIADDENKSSPPIDSDPAPPVASNPDASSVPTHDPPNPEP